MKPSKIKAAVSSLLLPPPSIPSAQKFFMAASESESRKELLDRALAEMGASILQLRWQSYSEGVYESVILEFKDGSAIKHTTWVNRADGRLVVNIKTVK